MTHAPFVAKPWQCITNHGGKVTAPNQLTFLQRVLLCNDIPFLISSVSFVNRLVSPILAIATLHKTLTPTSEHTSPSEEQCAEVARETDVIFDRLRHKCWCDERRFITTLRFWILWNYATHRGLYEQARDMGVGWVREPVDRYPAIDSIRLAIRNTMLNVVHIRGVSDTLPGFEEDRTDAMNPSYVVAAVTAMYASGAVFKSGMLDVRTCVAI